MKFNEIFQLNEALRDNKNLMRDLTGLWSPSIPEDQVVKYVDFFDGVKNHLARQVKGKKFDPELGKQIDVMSDYAPVGKFLARFPNFKEENLKSIDKYTAEQIKFLYSEIEKLPIEREKDVFTVNPEKNPTNPDKYDLSPNKAKLEASRDLWMNSKNNAIIDEGGFRVFKITNQYDSITFGYYQGGLQSFFPNSKEYLDGLRQWCTTYADENNAYNSYRSGGRTFYFIIDDSKNPDKIKEEGSNPTIGMIQKSHLYLSSLTIDGNKRYILTPTINGDRPVTLDYILEAYPQLRNHMDKIVYQPYDKNERLIVTDKIILTEFEVGPPQEFAYAPHNQQLEYVLNGNFITKAKSWSYMDSNTKKEYMRRMNKNNISALFPTYELLSKIEESISETKTFNFYLKQFRPDEDLSSLLGRVLLKSGSFEIYRRSIENPNLEVWRSSDEKNYGIIDRSKSGREYKKDNVTYKPQYVLSQHEHYVDEDANIYWVKYFTLHRKDNKTNLKESFYVVTEWGDENKLPAHFYTYDSFQKLLKEFPLEKTDDPDKYLVKKDVFSKDDEPTSDIKELFK